MVKNLPAKQETWVRSLGWKTPWRRKWQPTPVILSGKSHGQRSLVGYSPWGYKRAKHNLTTKTTAAKKTTPKSLSKSQPPSDSVSSFLTLFHNIAMRNAKKNVKSYIPKNYTNMASLVAQR